MTNHYERDDVTRRIEPAEATAAARADRPRGPRDLGPVVAGTAAVLGVLWLVVGLVILARAGIPTDAGLLDVRAEVGPFSGNAIAAAIAIIAGGAYLAVSTQRAAATMFGIGLTSIVFGLVWMIEPAAFGDVLGINRATASISLATGALAAIVGGFASETLFRRTGTR
jgi:hypothetical protein